jgi:hypothetical protein
MKHIIMHVRKDLKKQMNREQERSREGDFGGDSVKMKQLSDGKTTEWQWGILGIPRIPA